MEVENFAGPAHGTSLDDPSGFSRAREAHDAGAVESAVELPVHTVSIEFRLHADEAAAKIVADEIAFRITGCPILLPPVVVSVSVRNDT